MAFSGVFVKASDSLRLVFWRARTYAIANALQFQIDVEGMPEPSVDLDEASLLHHAQENAHRQRLDRRIVFEVITQPLGNRQHPLANWPSRKNVVGQVGGGFDHPPGVSSGTDTTALARMHA